MKDLLTFIKKEGFILNSDGKWYSPKYRKYMPKVVTQYFTDEELIKLYQIAYYI